MSQATQVEGITSIERGLEDQITCPVCHEHFKEPKILPCGHYYCKECIQALASRVSTSDQIPRPFPCPECRSGTLVPNNDPNQLPTAFFINRLKDLQTKMEKINDGKSTAKPGHCEMCSEGALVAFCHQCDSFICDDCVKSHQRMKIFAEHQVLSLDQDGVASKTLISRQPSSVTVRCAVHDKKLKVFCNDCREVICRDCIVVDHAGHSCEFLSKVSAEVKNTISVRLSGLKDVQQSISSVVDEIKITRDDIFAQKEGVSKRIEERFHKLQQVLEEHKEMLLKDVSQVAEQKLKNLSSQEAGLLQMSSDVQGFVADIEQRIEASTEPELLTIREQILGRIDEAIAKHSSDDCQLEPVEEADIRFMDMTITGESLKSDLLANAQIKHTSADPTKSVVEFGFVNEKELTMTLKPYLPNSKLTRRFQSVEVYVKSRVDGLVHPVTPERLPDNSYKVVYMPQVRGRHEFTISINDVKVEGSPFPMFVAVPPTCLEYPVRIIGEVKKPWGIAINSKTELVVTEHSGNVVFLDKYGSILREIKRVDHSFEFLSGVAVDNDDNVYVADYSRHTLFKFNRRGRLLKMVGRKGRGPCEFNKPRGLTVAKNHLYVCDYDNNRVQVLTLELNYVKDITPFSEVRDITIDESGQLYICDTGNNRIQVFSEEEELLFSFSAKDKRDMIGPCGICVANDFVYVVENPMYKDENVSIFSKHGKFVTSFGESGKYEGQFRNPYGITVDRDGFIYVCDYGNSRIQIF